MKTKRILATVMLAFTLFGMVNAAGKNKKALFNVAMHCESCQKRIEKNIPFEKGVKDMQVSLQKKTVEIAFDSTVTTVEKLKASIEKLGYECTFVRAQKLTKK